MALPAHLEPTRCLARDPRGAPPRRRRVDLRDLARAARGRSRSRRHACCRSTRRRDHADLGRQALRARPRDAAPGPWSARTLDVVARQGAATRPRTATASRRRRAPRPRRRPRSTPATASTSSSSATATGSPTPPRWRSPSSPARPTTRCSCTRRPGSARPTCCTRSATTCSRSAAAPRVRYTTVEAFTNHFISALGSRSLDRFKQRLPRRRRAADRRRPVPRQQGEDRGGVLPHVQRAVRDRPAARAHLRPPPAPARRGRGAPARALRVRASSPTIGPPDFATRVAILRKRAALDHIRLDDAAVLELIAERVTDNVRALEGALIRIVAYHSLTGRPIDVELAATRPRRDPSRSRRRDAPSIEQIQHAVAAHYGLTVAELDLAEPRGARRLAAPGRDPSDPASSPHASLQTIGAGVRRPQPRHRAPRLQARRRARWRPITEVSRELERAHRRGSRPRNGDRPR